MKKTGGELEWIGLEELKKRGLGLEAGRKWELGWSSLEVLVPFFFFLSQCNG